MGNLTIMGLPLTKVTPRVVYRRAGAGMLAAGLLAVGVFILWAWPHGGLPDTRVVMAAYLTLLLIAVALGCVALLASCHLAIHQAFSAGFQTGQVAHVDPIERAQLAAEHGRADPVVQLVR